MPVRGSRPSSSAARPTGSCGWGGTGPTGSRAAADGADEADDGVVEVALVVLPAPAGVVDELEVHLRAHQCPEEVQQPAVELGPEDQPEAAPDVQAASPLELGAPGLDLTVAGGGLDEGPPHARRALVDVGRHLGGGPHARLPRASIEAGEDL